MAMNYYAIKIFHARLKGNPINWAFLFRCSTGGGGGGGGSTPSIIFDPKSLEH